MTAISLQVIYPSTPDGKFDFDYYTETHLSIVEEHMGAFIQEVLVTRGISGGPDTPPPFVALATLTFANEDMFRKAMDAAKPVLADISKFTDIQPQMLIGEVLA